MEVVVEVVVKIYWTREERLTACFPLWQACHGREESGCWDLLILRGKACGFSSLVISLPCKRREWLLNYYLRTKLKSKTIYLNYQVRVVLSHKKCLVIRQTYIKNQDNVSIAHFPAITFVEAEGRLTGPAESQNRCYWFNNVGFVERSRLNFGSNVYFQGWSSTIVQCFADHPVPIPEI